MEVSNLLAFAAAYLAVLVLPGPGVTALVTHVLARGREGVVAFIAGFVTGSLVWFSLAATGLAVLAAAFAPVFVVIRYAGAAYLLYLAWKLWRAPGRPVEARPEAPERGGRLFLMGAAINLGNPKVIAFFLALLPTVVDLRQLTPLGFAELALIVTAVASSVLGAYAVTAARARRLFLSPERMRLANRSSAVVMAGTAVTIAVR